MRVKFALLIACCFFLLLNASAQQVFTVRGMVIKSKTGDRIAQVLVRNQRSELVTLSDDFGGFALKVALGDTLLVSKPGYTSVIFIVLNSMDTIVHLQPEILLNEVVIKDKTGTSEEQATLTDYRNKGLYFDGSPPLLIFNPISGSPLTGLHELLGKDAKDERHFINVTRAEQEAIYVDSRFTAPLVQSITKLPDEKVVAFMDVTRPEFKRLQAWNDYQLRQYIKAEFNDWQQRRP